jgi:hypothetical protein
MRPSVGRTGWGRERPQRGWRNGNAATFSDSPADLRGAACATIPDLRRAGFASFRSRKAGFWRCTSESARRPLSPPASRNKGRLKKAVDEILSGVTLVWQSLASCTDQALTQLQTGSDILEPTDFVLPNDVTQEEMLYAVRDLLSHLRAGQGLGFLCFRAPVVKRTRYLWRDFRFAGRLCDNVPVLADLADYLEQLSVLSNAWREWSAYATPSSGGFRHRLAKLQVCQRVLKELLELNHLAAGTEADLSRRGIASGQPVGKQWAVQAWQLIVRRIGRGTGKHVETLRRDARKPWA